MKILILCHEQDRLGGYYIYHLVKAWEDAGHRVETRHGCRSSLPTDVDVAILHVDLTVVPEAYTHTLRDYPVVINRNVSNISKSVISPFLVTEDDPYAGPVIIKTNNNCFGYREQMLLDKQNTSGIGMPVSWKTVSSLKRYPVLKSTRVVQPGVWENSNMVVEKFLSERDQEGNFCVRSWTFLGDRERLALFKAKTPVVKGSNFIEKIILPSDQVPEELRITRKRMGFDYGKFDYTMHNGKPVLFDLNKTVGTGPASTVTPEIMKRAYDMSLGILSFYGKNGTGST